MNVPNLSLTATSAEEMFAQLRATDITVPHITEGRKKEHREQYMMARFLATAARAQKIIFPLEVLHVVGEPGFKPDFVLRFGKLELGVECVEAVPQESYEIAVLREKDYPEAINFGQIFRPGEKIFNLQEKREVASGERLGSPWVGDMSKCQWVAAMEYFIDLKTKKLRDGNYSSITTIWLLIQDEWPVPLHYDTQKVRKAAEECLARIRTAHLLTPPCFQSIFICSGNQLICFEKGIFGVEKIYDLWRGC